MNIPSIPQKHHLRVCIRWNRAQLLHSTQNHRGGFPSSSRTLRETKVTPVPSAALMWRILVASAAFLPPEINLIYPRGDHPLQYRHCLTSPAAHRTTGMLRYSLGNQQKELREKSRQGIPEPQQVLMENWALTPAHLQSTGILPTWLQPPQFKDHNSAFFWYSALKVPSFLILPQISNFFLILLHQISHTMQYLCSTLSQCPTCIFSTTKIVLNFSQALDLP